MDSPIKKSSSPQEQLHPANYSVQELTHKIVTMKSPGAPQSNHEEEAVVVDHHALPQDITSSEEEEIKSAKAEMGNVKEENERLKQLLSKIVKDYHSLHTHFLQLVDHQRTGTTTVNNNKLQGNISDSPNYPPVEEAQESDELLFSLSLGRSSAAVKKEGVVGKRAVSCKEGVLVQGLSLGSMEYSTNADLENDNDDAEEEEEVIAAAEAWPPSKVLKTKRSSSSNSEEQQEEEVQILQPQLKKARVSIRARVETPTISDGCQWRKYGQKIAKGNPCPRAYYRCTVSPTCPVRKQVQRCVDDMTILITTYEGTHNHPLPLSATAMASTTSAAASMLQSCSSSSNPNASISNPSTTTNNVSPLSGHSQTTTTPLHQYYFPNSSISTCNSHPTITLDLTTTSALNNNNNNHVFAINTNRSSTSLAPRYSSSSTLDFSNSSSILPCNASNTMMGYYSSTFGNLLGKQRQAPTPSQHLHQPNDVQVGADMTIAAATKVIASNPCFRSALAAAITSFVGKGSETQDEVQNQGDQHRPFTMFQGSYDNNNMMSLFPPTAVNAMVPKVPLSSNSGASICRPFSAANSEDPVE